LTPLCYPLLLLDPHPNVRNPAKKKRGLRYERGISSRKRLRLWVDREYPWWPRFITELTWRKWRYRKTTRNIKFMEFFNLNVGPG
jgi:hypothetical protein